MKWVAALVLVSCASNTPAAMTLAGEGMAGQGAREWKNDLVLACDPSDADVTLDGVPTGTCLDFGGKPGALKLGDGLHKVEVKKSGFWPYETYVDAGGTRAALTVVLSPL